MPVDLTCPTCGKSFQVPPSVAQRGRRYCSLKCRPTQKREQSGGWRGGVSYSGYGYRLILVGKGKPMANNNGYVPEHRLVMSEHLGRPLTPKEHVHHRNGDILDNRIENLELLSRGEHTAHHNRGKSRALKRWSRLHDACIRCERTDRKHASHGLCTTCYMADRQRR